MYKIVGISSIKSKKNGKDYLIFHCQSVSPMPGSRGSGYEVKTVFCDISSVDVPELHLGDTASFYYNDSGFLSLIVKGK